MSLALQVLIVGLAAGAVYGLVAIGFTVVHRLTGVVHFALGELTGLAMFVTLFVASGTGPVTRTNVAPGRFLLGLVAGLAVSIAGGVGVYLVGVRPFVHRSHSAGWIGTTVAVAFAVRGLLSSLFIRESYVFPDPFRFDRLPNSGVLVLGHGVSLPVRTFLVIGVGVLLAVVAQRFLSRSSTGRALQAVASDWEAARMVGLPVDRLLAVAFGLAGALAALAALVAAPSAPITVNTGALLGLEGLLVALLASFGHPLRVFVTGLAVGVLQAAVASLHVGGLRLGSAYRDVVPLTLAIVVMAIRRGVQESEDTPRVPARRRWLLPTRAHATGATGGRRPPAAGPRSQGPFGRLPVEAGRALAEARSAWSGSTWILTATIALAAVAPLLFSELRVTALAAGLYTMVAAIGLNVAAGLGGMPSLGQGGFMAIGAFATAWLRVERGWDPAIAMAIGVVLAAAAGVLVGVGAVRLRPAFVAVVTWLASWLVLIALTAFPHLSGGSQGLAVPELTLGVPLAHARFTFSPAVHFELALFLVIVGLLGFRTFARAPVGMALSAFRQSPEWGAALGLNGPGLRLGAFVAGAVIAGLAGSLLVQLAGVADPAAYGPLLSVELFIAVLLGGAGRTWGPVVGVGLLGVIPHVAGPLGRAAGLEPARFEPIIAAVLLVAAVAVGGRGLLARVESLIRRLAPGRTGSPRKAGRPDVGKADITPGPGADRAGLVAEDLVKRYGGVVALDRVSLVAAGGEAHAVIGPNGSGKTTLLRAVAGAIQVDEGRILVEGRDVTAVSLLERAATGVVMVPARLDLFPELTALEHVVVGMEVRRRVGAFRSLVATPEARNERAELRLRGLAVLELFGLKDMERETVGRLNSADQRRVSIATAFASGPKLLLLDEPSAGLGRMESDGLVQVLERLTSLGVTLLVVEHNLQLVRLLAGQVTVLDAGGRIFEGSPSEAAANPEVARAYLGRAREAASVPRPPEE